MSQSKLRFYLDENMDPEIAVQLRQRGLDVLSAKEVSLLKVSDDVQLRYAAIRGHVICTKDSDFAKPVNWTVEHDGIAFFPDANASIGYVVNALEELYRSETPQNMKNSLRFL